MDKISRRRCTVLLLFFLLADALNTDLSAAGPAGWLLCPIAAALSLVFYRAFGQLKEWVEQKGKPWGCRLFDAVLLFFALWSLGRMVREFSGVLRTYNDFTRSPAFVSLLLLGTAFYLSRLHGKGLARTAELFFWPVAAILVGTFCAGLANCDFGRLLPLDLWGSTKGTLWLMGKVFAQGILALVLLERESDPEALACAVQTGTLLSGGILSLFLAKDVAQVGWAMASRYTYPLYALAGLTRSGTGMHIEDLLICALLAARLIKGAMLLRLMGDILKRWKPGEKGS